MKVIKKIAVIVFIFAGVAIILQSCKKSTVPVVTTVNVSAITRTSAVSGGNVTADGGEDVTARGVCWGTQQNPTITSSKTTDGKGTGAFTSNLTGLSPNTTYYVRAYATNSVGTSYGNEVSFASSPLILATLTTTVADQVTTTTAVSGGNITEDGGGAITARGVCWSTTQNPTIADSKTTDGAATGSFTSNITGLTPNTTYYVRAYATNGAGTSYGNEVSFTSSLVTLPTVTTASGSLITTITAVSGGDVTNDGGDPVISKGVCWSTSQDPTIDNSKTTDGTGTGAFVSNLAGLDPGTTYYVRAYATNGDGTAYGNPVTITTGPSTVTDVGGNTYNTVTIGSQVWMKENLKTTSYSNGDLIGTSNPLALDLTGESIPKYQWAYGGDESNVATYGRLYTWHAVSDSRNICPAGWHVPTDAEWTVLTTFLGGEDVAGGKLKEEGTTNWRTPNVGATNETTFTALPAGFRELTGYFDRISNYGIWWSSTPHETLADYAWYRHMFYNDAAVTRDDSYRKNAFSVRCVWGD